MIFYFNTCSLKHIVHWICTSIFRLQLHLFTGYIYLNVLNSVVLSTTFDNTLNYQCFLINFYKLTFIKMFPEDNLVFLWTVPLFS